jgi:hypothetical protein
MMRRLHKKYALNVFQVYSKASGFSDWSCSSDAALFISLLDRKTRLRQKMIKPLSLSLAAS